MLPRWIAAVLSVPLLACAAGLAATTGQVVPVESFEEYPLLAFPGQWIVRGDKDQARLIYQVAEVNSLRSSSRAGHLPHTHEAKEISS